MKESMKNASISANKQNCAPQIRKDCFSLQDAVFENFCFVTRSKRNYSSHLKKKNGTMEKNFIEIHPHCPSIR